MLSRTPDSLASPAMSESGFTAFSGGTMLSSPSDRHLAIRSLLPQFGKFRFGDGSTVISGSVASDTGERPSFDLSDLDSQYRVKWLGLRFVFPPDEKRFLWHHVRDRRDHFQTACVGAIVANSVGLLVFDIGEFGAPVNLVGTRLITIAMGVAAWLWIRRHKQRDTSPSPHFMFCTMAAVFYFQATVSTYHANLLRTDDVVRTPATAAFSILFLFQALGLPTFYALASSLAMVVTEYATNAIAVETSGDPEYHREYGLGVTMIFISSLTVGIMVGMVLDASFRANFAAYAKTRQAAYETNAGARRSRKLTENIFPKSLIDRGMTSGRFDPASLSASFAQATVVQMDIVGFSSMASRLASEELVQLLDSLFSKLDSLTSRHGLEKIKTLGDAYIAVAGVPHPCEDGAARALRFALDAIRVFRAAAKRGKVRGGLLARVGLGTGPCVVGVLGRRRYVYDIIPTGENGAMARAAKMEQQGEPDAVKLCPETTAALARLSLREQPDVMWAIARDGHQVATPSPGAGPLSPMSSSSMLPNAIGNADAVEGADEEHNDADDPFATTTYKSGVFKDRLRTSMANFSKRHGRFRDRELEAEFWGNLRIRSVPMRRAQVIIWALVLLFELSVIDRDDLGLLRVAYHGFMLLFVAGLMVLMVRLDRRLGFGSIKRHRIETAVQVVISLLGVLGSALYLDLPDDYDNAPVDEVVDADWMAFMALSAVLIPTMYSLFFTVLSQDTHVCLLGLQWIVIVGVYSMLYPPQIVPVAGLFFCAAVVYMAGRVVLASNHHKHFYLISYMKQARLRAEEVLERNTSLLQAILPQHVIEQLQGESRGMVAESIPACVVMFVEVKMDTSGDAGDAREQVAALNGVVCALDDVLEAEGDVEKIKFHEQVYFAAAGLEAGSDVVACAQSAMRCAVAMRAKARAEGWQMRIGLHTGPVTAGVIGKLKWAYDVWGDTVNLGARMMQYAEPGTVQASDAFVKLYEGSKTTGLGAFEPPRVVSVKGMGLQKASWFVEK